MLLGPPIDKTTTGIDTYQPKPWTGAGLGAQGCIKQIRAAYAIPGLEAPLADVGPTREVLFREKNSEDIIAELENDIRNGAVNLERTIAAMTRANAVQNILSELREFETRNARTQAMAMSERAASDLKSFWSRTNKELSRAAKLLPAEDPLNKDLVFAMDATEAYKRVVEALGVLAILASIYPSRKAKDGGNFRDILFCVSIPQFDSGYVVSQLSNHAKEPLSPERRGVRDLCRTANQVGRDIALVQVARGDYPGVTLAQPESSDEIAARMDSAAWALTNARADSWGWN